MRFKPVKDPVTGRIDMVPVVRATWGDKAESPSTSLALGRKRYRAALAMVEDGGISTVADLHDATLAEFTGLLAPHLDDAEIAPLARSWIEIAEMVREGTLRMGTLNMHVHMGDGPRLISVNMTRDDIVLTCFCTCHGNVVADPLVYWNDMGAFSVAMVEQEQIDDMMVDMQAQLRRGDLTHTALLARRAAASRPANVVDMKAWQTLRIVRGG